MRSCFSLQCHLWIPILVQENHLSRTRQVDAFASSPRGNQENLVCRVRIEEVDIQGSSCAWGGPIDSHITESRSIFAGNVQEVFTAAQCVVKAGEN